MATAISVSEAFDGSHASFRPAPSQDATRLASESCAVVHIIHPDEIAATGMIGLCARSGVTMRVHPDVTAFARSGSADAPGCVIVHLGVTRTRQAASAEDPDMPKTRLPLIVTADGADIRTAVLAMKAGAVDFFETPLRNHDLDEAVVSAIRVDRARREIDVRRAAVLNRFVTLTPREREVMALVTQGRLNKQIAWDLGLSEITVKAHRGSMMRKMAAPTLADLVRMADMLAEHADAIEKNALIRISRSD